MPDVSPKPKLKPKFWVALIAVVISVIALGGKIVAHEMGQNKDIITNKASAKQERNGYENVIKESYRRTAELNAKIDDVKDNQKEIQRDIKLILRNMPR